MGTRKDLREVFQLHAAGKTSVIRETRPLDQVNQAMSQIDGVTQQNAALVEQAAQWRG